MAVGNFPGPSQEAPTFSDTLLYTGVETMPKPPEPSLEFNRGYNEACEDIADHLTVAALGTQEAVVRARAVVYRLRDKSTPE